MQRRAISVALVGLLVVGLIAAAYLAAQPPTEQTTVTLMYPKEPTDSMLWPTNHSWVWSISRLDPSAKGESLSLVARVVHKRLGKGESPAIGPRTISKAESEAELSLGKVLGVKATDSAIICVQLVDLGEVAIPAGKRPLRLLLHLKARAVTASLSGEQIVIEGDRFVGQAPNYNPEWKDGELHLQTLWVQEDDRVTTYDVVVIQSK
jgi:hypothetical protein